MAMSSRRRPFFRNLPQITGYSLSCRWMKLLFPSLIPWHVTDKVYGLGENVRGINKRGWIYQSKCSDEPEHLEDRRSLYGAHNFFVVSGKETFGIFIDYPGILTFDIGYTRYSELKITASDWNLDVYVITGTDVKDIVHQFRQLIGRSFVVPKWPSVTARAAGAICPRTRSGTW